MGSEKKDEKARDASLEAVIASVTEEMRQPRIAKSARASADEPSMGDHGKTTTQNAGRTAKPHIEQYGTGTPAVEKKS
jgi:hypothetical protein